MRLFSLLILLSTVTTLSAAQMRGSIRDKRTHEPLIGATIQIEGTTNGAITDFDGNFLLVCDEGKYNIVVRYVGYETITLRSVPVGIDTERIFEMDESGVLLADVTLVGHKNMESESMLLMEQRQSLVATQAIGARELSRKGVSDAQAAVTKVSGVATGGGQKNVNVRGLGDRYNATFLNGFAIPGEDPEYKNISLSFFPSNLIRSITVQKAFSATNESDVAGAAIDITSKRLTTDAQFEVSLSAGANTTTFDNTILRPAGLNGFGIAHTAIPTIDGTQWQFTNSLNPTTIAAPVNQSYSILGGKKFNLGNGDHHLNIFAAASYDTDYSHTTETTRNTTTRGTITRDMTGLRSTTDANHMLMANLDYEYRTSIALSYRFLLLHSAHATYATYRGYADDFNFGDGGEGITIRQQINDNTLQIHQLHTDFDLSPRWTLNFAANYNRVLGNEPDRRINTLTNDCGTDTTNPDWRYEKGDGAQQRYYSRLTDDNLSTRIAATYDLPSRLDGSSLTFGYKGRYTTNSFQAHLFNTNILYAKPTADPDHLDPDAIFSPDNLAAGTFRLSSNTDRYTVHKTIHKAFAEVDYIFSNHWSGNLGVAADYVDIDLDYNLNNDGKRGQSDINRFYLLPSLNLRYDPTDDHSLRLGLSKTYTLPQAKELAPFRYYDVSFSSEGNKNLRPSDCYNIDLRWEYYLTPTQLISATTFYKYIANPIARVDQANAAAVLTYMNIAPSAQVAGIEIELRKDLLSLGDPEHHHNRLSLGINGSYIYSYCRTDLPGATHLTGTSLEGAAPWILNADLSYNLTTPNINFSAAAIFNFVSERIYVTGMQGYADTRQSPIYSLDLVASLALHDHWTIGIKAKNLIDPAISLTRTTSQGTDILLSSYRRGIDLSLTLSYKL